MHTMSVQIIEHENKVPCPNEMWNVIAVNNIFNDNNEQQER